VKAGDHFALDAARVTQRLIGLGASTAAATSLRAPQGRVMMAANQAEALVSKLVSMESAGP
jgi:hypothetical protein